MHPEKKVSRSAPKMSPADNSMPLLIVEASCPEKNMDTIEVGKNRQLTLTDLAYVARNNYSVTLGTNTPGELENSRNLLKSYVAQRKRVYGLSTPFGDQSKYALQNLDDASIQNRQQKLVRSHTAGAGPLVSKDIVRGAILLRAHCLAQGYSGVRPEVIEAYLNLLNQDVIPQVARYGSIGASGDLIPLAQVASLLFGEEEDTFVSYGEAVRPYSEVKATLNLQPTQLEGREGLALINGTSFMSSVAGLAVFDLSRLHTQMLSVIGMTLEALETRADSYNPDLHRLKGHEGQIVIAEWLNQFWTGSQLIRRAADGSGPAQPAPAPTPVPPAPGPIPPVPAPGPLPPTPAPVPGPIPPTPTPSPLPPQAPAPQPTPIPTPPGPNPSPIPAPVPVPGPQAPQLMPPTLASRPRYRYSAAGPVSQVETPVPPTPPVPAPGPVPPLPSQPVPGPHTPDTGSEAIQDVYSMRAVAHGFGPMHENLERALHWIVTEMNSVNDNPLALDGRIYGSAHFMGYYVTSACDGLKMDIAQAATWLHALLANLVHDRKSRGLPANLVENPAEDNGFRPLQILATALTVQCRKLAQSHAAYVLPTEGDNQDVNSLGTHAAFDLKESVERLEEIVAILLFASAQALELRGIEQASPRAQAIVNAYRTAVPRLDEDRRIQGDIAQTVSFLREQRDIFEAE